MTENTVYTTYYKTIHAKENYQNDTDREDRYNDSASRICRSLAFSLACTTGSPVYCDCLDWTDKKNITDRDVFDHLAERHGEKSHSTLVREQLETKKRISSGDDLSDIEGWRSGDH